MTDQTIINCLCGKVNEKGLVASRTLPVETELCHCNPCRYTTGTIGASFVPLASRPSQSLQADNQHLLVGYDSSAKLTRYFCGTCGSHCFVNTHRKDKWYACSGVVEHATVAPPEQEQQSAENVK